MSVFLVELERTTPQQPIGLYYISAVLEQGKIPVEVFDLHYKKDIARFEDGLRTNPPVLVGVSCVDENIARAVSVILHTKKITPQSKTVLGGPGTYFQKYKDLLQTYPEIDYLAKGEGEHTTLELYHTLTQGGDPVKVPNLVFFDDDAFLSTPLKLIEDLDSLPFPRRPARYSKDRFDIISGRGCPQACTFCDYSFMHQKTYRRRSWENVFDEIEALPAKLDKRTRLHFCDERFLPNAQGFLEEKQKRGLEFTFYASARLDHIVEYKDVLKPLWEAGLKRVEGGIESPSHNERFEKGFGKDTIKEAFKTISELWKQDVRIDHEFYGIGFTKDTTLESLRDDCRFYKRLFEKNWHPYLTDRWLSRSIKDLFGTMKLDYGTPVFKEYYTEFKQRKDVQVFGQTYKLHVPADKPDPAWKEELEETLRRSNKNRIALQIFWTANPDLEAIREKYHSFLRGPMKQIEDHSYLLTRAFLERDFINNQPEREAERMEWGVAYHLNRLEMAPLYYLQDLAEGFLQGKEGPNDPRLIERMLEKADQWIARLKRFKKTCNVPIPKQLSD